MKFRILVAILTVAIIVLFSMVVKYSYDLKLSESKLTKSKDSLMIQKDEIDRLFAVNKKQLETLSRATDSIYFAVARTSNTFKSYKNYLANFGEDGEYYYEALLNINALFPKTGYVQLIESNGNKLYAKFEDTDGFPDTVVYMDSVPSVTKNNLYICKSAMNVRNGVMGNPDFSNTNRNGDVIWEEQMVKVLGDVIESGSSKWVHIAYSKR
jgi:Tfp pilus assembly protein PilE